MFESQPRQNQVVKTGSDSSTAKRSAVGVSVTDPRRWPLWMDAPCHSSCGTLKNPHCSMAMSAKHRSSISKLSLSHEYRITWVKRNNKRPKGHIAHLRKHTWRRFRFPQCILLFFDYLSLDKGWIRSPKDALCKVWFKMEKQKLLNLLFRNYLAFKKFDWNWSFGSGEKLFKNIC